MKNSSLRFSIFSLLFMLCLVFSCQQQGEKSNVEKKAEADLELDKIPRVIMDALKAKFPQAEIHKWTKEKEGDIVVYDIEFIQEDRKFEADIKEDGTIHNWEKEITDKDLPETVKTTVETNYPQSIIKEIMEITAVQDGQDALEGYEIVLETADKKDIEVTVAPDGKILEEDEETE